MLNLGRILSFSRYSLFKYLLVVVVFIFAIVYALPNFFGKIHSLKILHKNGLTLSESSKKIQELLDQEKITYRSLNKYSDMSMQLTFQNVKDQLSAKTLLQTMLGDHYTVILNMTENTPKWLRSIGASPMNLGLDLRGGIYLTLEADIQSLININLDNTQDSIVQGLKNEGIAPLSLIKASQKKYLNKELFVPFVYYSVGYTSLIFDTKNTLDTVMTYLKNNYAREQNSRVVYTTLDDKTLLISFNINALTEIKQTAISQVVTVMRNRIDALGVSESFISAFGDSRVVIELPGLQDATRAKQILGSTSAANFYLMKPVSNLLQAVERGLKIYPITSYGTTRYYRCEGNAIVAGGAIIKSSAAVDFQTGQPIVAVQLNKDVAKSFRDITSQNLYSLMGVILVNTIYKKQVKDQKLINNINKTEKLINVAKIQNCLGANFQITGLNQREANDLALMIRSGALQVPVYIAQEKQIGPTLGQKNVNQGIISIIVALILVTTFMSMYYHLFGIIANFSLIFNLILIVAVMSVIPGTTLTLPGIAGIVLNLGMSIDGNVLVFERIREELRNGLLNQMAIHVGYDKAFATIVDSNLTTLIVAIILFVIGTGSVKGFAVTLIIGIISSMFTAITVSRALTDLVYSSKLNFKKLSIGI